MHACMICERLLETKRQQLAAMGEMISFLQNLRDQNNQRTGWDTYPYVRIIYSILERDIKELSGHGAIKNNE